MEIIDSLIFTQAFVWGVLLVRKPVINFKLLGYAFFAVSAVYILKYCFRTFNIQNPDIIFPASTLFIGLLVSSSLSNIFIRKEWDRSRFSWWVRLFIALVLIIVSLILSIEALSVWWYTILILFFSLLSDISTFEQRISNKTYTGRFWQDPITLNQFIILCGTLILIFSGILASIQMIKMNPDDTMVMLFHIITAMVLFVVGYNSVSTDLRRAASRMVKNRTESWSSRDNQIRKLMEKEKPYLDCELTLGKMAEMLDIDEPELSRVLNEEMGVNFYGLINEYRIKTVMEKLKEPGNRKFTIMASAYESGFNSKSTFYRIFKEYTGLTPKEYLLGMSNDL